MCEQPVEKWILACGEGHCCRTLVRRGAARVLGVDISAGMIGIARQQEVQEPLGVEYLCRDVLALGTIGSFDLVVAAFLLNYAKSEDELIRMCRTAYDNLRPGGDSILIDENVEQAPRDYHGYARYGYAKTIAEPADEGSVIRYTMAGERRLCPRLGVLASAACGLHAAAVADGPGAAPTADLPRGAGAHSSAGPPGCVTGGTGPKHRDRPVHDRAGCA